MLHMETVNTNSTIDTIMTDTTTIEIGNDTLDELREIGNDFNAIIKDLIHEHNCNRQLEAGEKRIREHRAEFVSVHDL